MSGCCDEKMREALAQILALAKARGLFEIQSLSETALAEPPRNCDVGTAEEQEDRYVRFCDSHMKNHGNCFGCAALKPRGRCEFAWAQMPYEEGGEK